MTFVFLIACAWIVARPILAVIMFLLIFVLMFIGKNSRDKYSPKYNPNEPYGNNQGQYPSQHGFQKQGYPPQQSPYGYQQQGKAKFL